ncbi:MAG: dTDP-4-amino-4,6-dideoxygalactose transaminase [bacterium]
MIPFNKPFIVGKELDYIAQAVGKGKTSGNCPFTKRCQEFFERRYGFTKCLLTTSGTDALEMAAILADIQPGDEVIMPSFTFVSTALAFVRQGATIVFADSCRDNPNLDAESIEPLITSRTKVLVPVHYAGVACNMKKIMSLAAKYHLLVVSDDAHAIDAHYTGRLPVSKFPWQKLCKDRHDRYPLGGIAHLGCFSFHETKNIQCGEGGMLSINDPKLVRRAEIIWEKGTNRADYFRGEVKKYEWVDVGSSFLPSGITAAFLWAQLQDLRRIQNKRVRLWNFYFAGLKPLADRGFFDVPQLPTYATNNAHMFYVVCRSAGERDDLQAHLASNGVQTATHYQSLHDSAYYRDKYRGAGLVNCKRFVECLLRLPLFYDLELGQVRTIISAIKKYYISR